MSDDWDFYLHQIGDNAASTFVDLGIYSEVPDRKRPFLLKIRLKMQIPREDGLSSKEEFHVLCELEKGLVDALKRSSSATHVGRTTGNGCREFCFYAPQPVAKAEIVSALRSFPEYEFEFSCTEDSKWNHYLEVLYPSREEFEVIKNQRVLEALENHGDNHEQERPVTHWSFFKTNADRQSFLSEALEKGFSIHDLHEKGPDETPFVACLERNDSVDYHSINNVVLDLFALTENHNGFYDGWETQVTEAEDSEHAEEDEQ